MAEQWWKVYLHGPGGSGIRSTVIMGIDRFKNEVLPEHRIDRPEGRKLSSQVEPWLKLDPSGVDEDGEKRIQECSECSGGHYFPSFGPDLEHHRRADHPDLLGDVRAKIIQKEAEKVALEGEFGPKLGTVKTELEELRVQERQMLGVSIGVEEAPVIEDPEDHADDEVVVPEEDLEPVSLPFD